MLIRLASLAGFGCATDVEPRILATTGGSSGAGAASGASGGNVAAGGDGGAISTMGGVGAGASGGAIATGGGADGTAGAMLACAPPAAAQACDGTVPKKQTLLAFATYTPDGDWGQATIGDLTGGTSKFQGEDAAPLELVVEGRDTTATLHVTGAIPSASYAGFVFWFGPCVNAAKITNEAEIQPSAPIVTSATTGISFALGGNLGGSQLKLQVQTHSNYPADAGYAKGGCMYSSCATRWSDCSAPTQIISAVALDMIETPFPWASFVDGKPEPVTNGDGIVGLQFQFECVSNAPCAIDVRLGSIRFTK